MLDIKGINIFQALVLLASLPAVINGDDCKKIDNCSCRMADKDGGVVTLRPLGNTDGTPVFFDQEGDDGYLYSYNPCFSFNEDDCSKSAFCQRQTQNGTTKSLAGQQNVQFGFDGHNVQVTYLPSDGLFKDIKVSYVCVENLSPPVLEAHGFDDPTQSYYFTLQSKCACPNVCYSPSDDDGLGAGTILIIVCVSILFAYIVIGSIHNRVTKNARGLQMLPHYEFWISLPGTAKDGCVYAAKCTCCRPRSKKYDEV